MSALPPAATVINVALAGVYVALAVVTNKFLLQRIDKLAQVQEHEALQRQLSRGQRYLFAAPAVRHVQSTSNSSRSMSGAGGPVGPAQHTANGARESGLSASSSSSHRYLATGPVSRSEEVEDVRMCVLRQLRRAIFCDYASWFFALIVLFALTRSVTVLTTTLTDSKQVLDVSKTMRDTQDTIFFPSSVLYYTVAVVLLHTFHYLSDVNAPKPLLTYRLRLGAAVGVLVISAVVCLVLVATEKYPLALEWASVVYGFVLSAAFFAASFQIPRKVSQFSGVGDDLPRRIRIVSLVLCIALAARSVLLLPDLQQYYGDAIGPYAVCVAMPFDLLPMGMAVWILHR